MKAFRFLVILAVLVAVDWALGVAQAKGLIPLWTFLLANVPVGLVFVWFESQWVGTHYEVLGARVSDLTSLAVFFGVVLIQACLYWLLFNLWWDRRQRHHPA